MAYNDWQDRNRYNEDERNRYNEWQERNRGNLGRDRGWDRDFGERGMGRDWELGGRDYGRDSSRDFGRDYSRDSNRDFGRDLGRDYGRDFGRYGDLGGGSRERMVFGRDPSRGTEVRRDYGQELGRGDYYRGGYGERDYGRGFDLERRYGGDYQRSDMSYGSYYNRGLGSDYGRNFSGYDYYRPDGGRGIGMGMGGREGVYRPEDDRGFFEKMRDYFRRESSEQRPRRRGPKGWKRSDERMLEEANEALANADIDSSEIIVRVENGICTLEGMVPSRRDKRIAEMVVEEVRGIDDVLNHVRVQREETTTSTTETRTGRNDRSRREGSIS